MNRTPRIPYLLGIDLGTSGCKVVALALDGTTLASSEARYPMSVPRPGWAEQEPQLWWDAVVSAMLRLGQQLPFDARPAAIGVTGQMHSLVALDSAMESIRPSILWCDQRTEPEARQITAEVGSERLLEVTRNPSRAAFTASKILWLRANEPASYQRLAHVLLPKDWLVYKLTGVLTTEPSDASGTGLFDVVTNTWSDELITRLHLKRTMFPEVRLSSETVGTLTDDASSLLGLPAGTPVIAGAGDQAAAAYDAGAVTTGVVACNLGTSVALTKSVAAPVEGSLSHVVPGQWLYLTSAHSGTIALDWWSRVAGNGRVGEIIDSAAESEPGARGAKFIPLLLGSRNITETPHLASFSGLREDHNRADLARAVLEGLALEVRHVGSALPRTGEESTWRVFGGGVRGPLLVQILSDVLATPLQIVPEASSARGVARLAGVGLGLEVPMVTATRARISPSSHHSYDIAYREYEKAVA